jgi:hypothetical protein
VWRASALWPCINFPSNQMPADYLRRLPHCVDGGSGPAVCSARRDERPKLQTLSALSIQCFELHVRLGDSWSKRCRSQSRLGRFQCACRVTEKLNVPRRLIPSRCCGAILLNCSGASGSLNLFKNPLHMGGIPRQDWRGAYSARKVVNLDSWSRPQ